MHRDGAAECFLELTAFEVALSIVAFVHLVRKRDLLAIVRRQEPDFVQHTGESTSSIRSTREPEQADLVTCLVCMLRHMS